MKFMGTSTAGSFGAAAGAAGNMFQASGGDAIASLAGGAISGAVGSMFSEGPAQKTGLDAALYGPVGGGGDAGGGLASSLTSGGDLKWGSSPARSIAGAVAGAADAFAPFAM